MRAFPHVLPPHSPFSSCSVGSFQRFLDDEQVDEYEQLEAILRTTVPGTVLRFGLEGKDGSAHLVEVCCWAVGRTKPELDEIISSPATLVNPYGTREHYLYMRQAKRLREMGMSPPPPPSASIPLKRPEPSHSSPIRPRHVPSRSTANSSPRPSLSPSRWPTSSHSSRTSHSSVARSGPVASPRSSPRRRAPSPRPTRTSLLREAAGRSPSPRATANIRNPSSSFHVDPSPRTSAVPARLSTSVFPNASMDRIDPRLMATTLSRSFLIRAEQPKAPVHVADSDALFGDPRRKSVNPAWARTFTSPRNAPKPPPRAQSKPKVPISRQRSAS